MDEKGKGDCKTEEMASKMKVVVAIMLRTVACDVKSLTSIN